MINRNLGLLLSGQLVSQVGDKFHMLAVAFMVLQSTGSPAQMGLVLFCSMFPGMVLGVVAGAFLDRHSRKAIIVGADLARGFIVAGLCALYYWDALSFPLLLTAQVMISICTAFFDPAIPAVIPQIVAQDQLTRANSQVQFVRGISMIAGPALGGLFAAWAGYLAVFMINAASYLISAGFECFLKIPRLQKPSQQHTSVGQEILAGWCYVQQRKNLSLILAMVGVIHLFVGCIEALIPLLARDLDGGGPGNMGYLQTALGLGMVLAAASISLISLNRREAAALFSGVFIFGLMLIAVSALYLTGIRGLTPFLIPFLIMGGAVIFAATGFRSILQKGVIDEMMGRVFGLVSSIGNTSLPLAMLLVGFCLEYVPHSMVALASGTILLPLSLFSMRKYNLVSESRSNVPSTANNQVRS